MPQLYVALINGVPFAVALLAGLLLPGLAWALARRFEAGVAFVAVVFALDAAVFSVSRLQLGVNVYPSDLAYALLGLVALLRWVGSRDMPQRPWGWFAYAALFGLALAGGLALHGRGAGVQAREPFYALACASYAMSFRVDERRLRALWHALGALGVVLLLIAAYRWLTYYAPIPSLLPPGGEWSADGPTRVIASNEALLLAQWLLLGVFFAASSPAAVLARWLAPLLLAAVVVLQHRSVWLAAVVGAAAALLAARAAQATRLLQLAVLVVAATLVAVPALYSDSISGLTREVEHSATTAVAGQGTVHARLQDWRQTLGEFRRAGPQVWLIGYGYGRDTTRRVVDERGELRFVAFGVHNHYLSLLLTTGLLGLGVFAGLLARTAFALWRRARAGDSGAALLLTLLAAQAAYFVPYASDALQYFVLGTAMAYVATRARTAPTAAPAAGAALARDVAWR